jgi:putative pyoverdin transport system ATP-binding/permease protein
MIESVPSVSRYTYVTPKTCRLTEGTRSIRKGSPVKFIPWKLIRFYLKYTHRKVFISAIVGLVAGASGAALIAQITSSISHLNGSGAGWRFAVLAMIVLATNVTSGFLSTQLANQTGLEMRTELCRLIMAAPLRKIEEAGTPRLLATFTQDIPPITGAFLRVPGLCTNIAKILGCLFYLGTLSTSLLMVPVIFLILSVLSYIVPQKRANRILRGAREDWDLLISHFRALSEGAKEFKLNRRRRKAFFSGHLLEVATSFQRRSVAGQQIYVLLNNWSLMLYFIVIGLILFILPGALENIDPKTLTGYALMAIFMSGPVAQLVGLLPTFNSANISLRRLDELGLSLIEGGSKAEQTHLPNLNKSWKRLELVGITHTYQREQGPGSFVLGPIDLDFHPGELIFLVGGNGSGKTTLAKLLTGLYIPESGEIRVDGRSITDETREYYRQYFSAVFSDFYLFDHLIGIDAADLDRRAGVYLEKFQLSNKLEIKSGKLSTTELSRGQRRRLALLTAYLEDRPVYVFDEWAADQDPAFKDVFYYQLLPELKQKGKTIFVISHDNRYFHIADRVIKLDYGKIEVDERGATPPEGAYAQAIQ